MNSGQQPNGKPLVELTIDPLEVFGGAGQDQQPEPPSDLDMAFSQIDRLNDRRGVLEESLRIERQRYSELLLVTGKMAVVMLAASAASAVFCFLLIQQSNRANQLQRMLDLQDHRPSQAAPVMHTPDVPPVAPSARLFTSSQPPAQPVW